MFTSKGKIKPILLLHLALIISCNTEIKKEQKDMIRSVSEVEQSGRKAVRLYEDQKLASYGILDVTKAPYNADSSGMTDATEAIQQAINDARDARLVTYLPPGEYKISNTIAGIQGTVQYDDWPYEGFADPWIKYQSFYYPCVLMGARENGRAKLVLVDHAPGFGNPEQPKPVLYFWARNETPDFGKGSTISDPRKHQGNINFNQIIMDVDIDLGEGNAGAVGIHHNGAECSTIEDVTIYANDSYAGFTSIPASGGAAHGITVRGGRYGLHLVGNPAVTQPVPLISNLVLTGQSECAILYDSFGPLTIIGAWIEGSGIQGVQLDKMIKGRTGCLNIVDAVIIPGNNEPAIISHRSIVLNNVYVKNTSIIARVSGHTELQCKQDNWTLINEYVASTDFTDEWGTRKDQIWINGGLKGYELLDMNRNADAPPHDICSRHSWECTPTIFSKNTTNVKESPYFAKGDGKSDDTDAIQKAINDNKTVFLPKGTYRISRPLQLKSYTQLTGLTSNLTTISPIEQNPHTLTHNPNLPFCDTDKPLPLVVTEENAEATTMLAFIGIEVPTDNPAVYALLWRSGRQSIVRNVYPSINAWHPHSTACNIPRIRIEGSGGGKWYNVDLLGWWSQGPDYRHIAINDTHEPLSFYKLEPVHGRGTTMVEIWQSQNINIYGLRGEGDFSVLDLKNCCNIRIFGYSGNGMPFKGYALLNINNCNNTMIANIVPFYKKPGKWGALGAYSDPEQWYLINQDNHIKIPGTERITLYKCE